MKKLFFVALLNCVVQLAFAQEQPVRIIETTTAPVDWVNPLMGTQSKHALSNGNVYPAVALPWGMNFWTPQTGRMGDGWVYTYDADKINGFRQIHQPSPWIGDYGQFSIMPVTSGPLFGEEARASWFSHKAETARPYYYSVYLADHDVTTELAPTQRAVMFRFTFPERENSYVVVDAFDRASSVTISPDRRRITGYTTRNSGGVPDNFKNWFVVEFDRPFSYTGTVADGKLSPGEEKATAGHSMAVVGFPTRRGEVVHARVASSFISLEQAERNLHELPATFDETAARGRERWNEVLGAITVEGGTVDQTRTFYSCLYRSVLFPRDLSEIDANGARIHYSPYNGKVLPGEMFTDTGFWDTFRSLFPLVNLVWPDMGARMQQGLANTWLESGFLPEWASPGHRDCMVGNNSASVVADAWLGGIRGQDIGELWNAVTHGSGSVHPDVRSTGRLGWEYYNRLGYIPYDVGINENAARTLEYAYDDWCIWRLGKALGRPASEIDIYARRAVNYRNLFDSETKLMRGRNADGTFQSPFNPLKWGDAFTEGNSLHYTWSVFHDPAGLISLMGGKAEFNRILDGVFDIPPTFDESYYGFVIHEIREMQIMNMGNYAHGNQPAQHILYLYNWSGEPWKAQARVREVMEKLYRPTPDGYCGDEDNGQTSAWYVFSAMGFYPVCPGSGEYALGSPLFRKVTVRPTGGRPAIGITASGAHGAPYIEAMTVNGAAWSKNFVTHADLVAGARVDFRMSVEPNTTRGTAPADAPYSFSDAAASESGAGSGSEAIGLFDLTYTHSYDLDNPERVESLWDDIHAVATLQGVVNRDSPRLYIDYVNRSGVSIDDYWWDKYRQPGKWLHGRATVEYPDIERLIEAYRSHIDGVVVYDPAVASTSNVASAVSGIDNLIAVRYDTDPGSLYSRIVSGGPRLDVRVWLISPDGSPMFTGQGTIPGTDRPSTGSTKNDPYIWFIERYMKTGRCNGEFGAYYIDQKWRENPRATVVNHHTLTNHDFFVSKRAFFFDLSPWGDEPATDDGGQPLGTDLATLKEFLMEAYRINRGEKMCYIGGFPSWIFKYTGHVGGIHGDVDTEWEFSRLIGAYNAFKDADAIGYGALANASFWTHYPLRDKYPQRRVTLDELRQRGLLDADGRVDFRGRDFYIFYVGDYDASSWVAQCTPTIWDDPDRGSVPMMWAVSPVLEHRVPMALEYYRRTATENDYFVAADNGAGYLMPGMLQEPRGISGLPSGLDTWARHCKPYYERWDLTITGFVIDGTAPGLSREGLDCYASFSPDGIVPQKVPTTLLHGDMPVLRSDYDIVDDDPEKAARLLLERVRVRPVPFHWFRNILKTPQWYGRVSSEVEKLNPNLVLLDAPTFFALYKEYLKQTPEAAAGDI